MTGAQSDPLAEPSAKLLLRALGPELAGQHVTGPLNNPALELHDSNGVLISANDNWKDDPVQEALILATGLAPTSDLESAIDVTVAPGAQLSVPWSPDFSAFAYVLTGRGTAGAERRPVESDQGPFSVVGNPVQFDNTPPEDLQPQGLGVQYTRQFPRRTGRFSSRREREAD